MKSIILLSLLLFLYARIFSQEINQTIKDNKTDELILLGKCNKLAFYQEPFKKWYENEYNTYMPAETIIKEFKKFLNDKIKIIVFFGSWCEDSQKLLPQFIKTMDIVGYTPNTIELIAVDRNFKQDNNCINYKVNKVPTFIFYNGDKEIGRIVESVSSSIENDILKILKKQ